MDVTFVAAVVDTDGAPEPRYEKLLGPTQADSLPASSLARTQMYLRVLSAMAGAVQELDFEVYTEFSQVLFEPQVIWYLAIPLSSSSDAVHNQSGVESLYWEEWV